jgi:hypothetical protein
MNLRSALHKNPGFIPAAIVTLAGVSMIDPAQARAPDTPAPHLAEGELVFPLLIRLERHETELDERIGLIAPIEKSHASLAQFRTETKYASLWGKGAVASLPKQRTYL